MSKKLFLHPFNDAGEMVKRGVVSIHGEASRQEIAARIDQQVMMAGIGKIVHVEVKSADGVIVQAWDVRKSTIVQTDGEGSVDFDMACFNRTQMENAMTEPTTEMTAEEKIAANKAERERIKQEKLAEREAAKAAKGEEAEKAKAEKEAHKKATAEQKAKEREEAKAAKAAERAAKAAEREQNKTKVKASKGPTKKDRVQDMLSTGNGATVEDIAAALEISDIAARSLISDLKRAGIIVTSAKGEDKKTYYTAPARVTSDEAPAEGGETESTEADTAETSDAPTEAAEPVGEVENA